MILFDVLRPAVREQLSKLFHVEEHDGAGWCGVGEFWAKKNPQPFGQGFWG